MMNKKKQKIIVRIPVHLRNKMMADLDRSHPFAAERVGFFETSAILQKKVTIVAVTDYHSISDEQYDDDASVGAKIGHEAIRAAMQRIITNGKGCLHVHRHTHKGVPGPSFTDLDSLPDVAKGFANADRSVFSGYLIASDNNFYCSIYDSDLRDMVRVSIISVVDNPIRYSFGKRKPAVAKNEIMSRQEFLGEDADVLIHKFRVGVVGLGGGGSHVAQQLAHIGLERITLFDDDVIELSNLNRLVGARYSDVIRKKPKVKILKRLIKSVNPAAKVRAITAKWQDAVDELKLCDIIVGCVDSFQARKNLESTCRGALIPLIDIGMEVNHYENYGHGMSGQVILSMPGDSCFECLQFINDNNLGEEMRRYGDVGGRPQVVWPNGVLASTAVGYVVQLITGWTPDAKKISKYLSYDGNTGRMVPHPRLEHVNKECGHYRLSNAGKIVLQEI